MTFRLDQAYQKIAELSSNVNGLKDTNLRLKSDKAHLNNKINELTQDLNNRKVMINQHLVEREKHRGELEDSLTKISTLQISVEELKKVVELKDEQIAIANNK